MFVLSGALAVGQGAPGWREVEEGKALFATRSFDLALSRFARAREIRRIAVQEASRTLDIVISPPGKAAGTTVEASSGPWRSGTCGART
jgi:hypothetical protein